MDASTILLIATGTGEYASGNLPTGLWLSELTHIYHSVAERQFDITVASPKGGNVPVDPESLKPLLLDKMSKNYWNDPAFRHMLQHTESLEEVSGKMFDCIYLAGGHGTMYDFPNNAVLQSIVKTHFESNRMVAAICHGVCGLLNVRLSGGDYLVRNKELTGYSWFEEILACREKEVPFNLEEALKERGADYRKAFIPMTSKVVVDGNLITGQNPFSSEEIAKVILQQLEHSDVDARN